MEGKILNYIKENFHKSLALFAGIFLLLLIIASTDNLFSQFTKVIGIGRWYIYSIFFIIWLLIWLYYRYNFPKNKENSVGLIVCLRTENDKQKIRLRDDFVKRLNELVKHNNLAINVLLLNNYRTDMICRILDDYSKKINEIKKNDITHKKLPKEVKRWFKIQKKINGHFFIWGSIKERQDIENKYFLDMEALVIHNPVDSKMQKELSDDFLTIWYKQVSFLEKIEFRGFILTADLVYMAVKYITGIAALISKDPYLAIQLHSNLINDFSKFQPLPLNLQRIKNKTKILLAEENFILAKWSYSKGDINKAKEYLDESFKYLRENYGGYLLKALIEFSDQNPKESLKTTRIAKKYSGRDGAWLYNEAFLLMYLGEHEKAMMVYKKIHDKFFFNESSVLKEVYRFNEKILVDEPDKIESYFIIGYLKYKKDKNWPEAFLNFELFLEKSINNLNFSFLIKKAISYKIDCENKMNLKHKHEN